jgi:hypothetical protein
LYSGPDIASHDSACSIELSLTTRPLNYSGPGIASHDSACSIEPGIASHHSACSIELQDPTSCAPKIVSQFYSITIGVS